MRKYKLFILILSTILFTLIVTSIAFASNIISKDDVKIENNQVIFKDKPITSSDNEKGFPCLSPNGKSVAFFSKSTDGIFDEIGIYDSKTENFNYVKLENIFYTTVLGVEWVDESRVSFLGHVNPSLDVYVLIDANNGEIIRKYDGTGFKWDKTKSHIYYSLPSPHFSDKLGVGKILKDGEEVIFETEDDNIILGGPSITDDSNKLAFFSMNINDDKVKLILLENGQDKKFENKEEIEWDNNNIGEISFIDNNEILINSRFEETYFDIMNKSLIKSIKKEEEKKNPFINYN